MSREKTNDISRVTVTFHDGEVSEYFITASPSIGGFLAREAGANGVLSLYNDKESYAIPLESIREWKISAVAAEECSDDPKRDGEQ